jgi:hypothetical protein
MQAVKNVAVLASLYDAKPAHNSLVCQTVVEPFNSAGSKCSVDMCKLCFSEASGRLKRRPVPGTLAWLTQ